MSFRGGGRGRGRGGGDRGGRFGGRGRGRGSFEEGPPAEVCELGTFLHDAEGELVCRLTNSMIPYFNAGVYLESKSKIGKVEEVFGPINKVYFTVKPDTGISGSSFQVEDKVYISTEKLLPLSKFTNEAKGGGGGRGSGRGGSRGGGGRGLRGGPAGRSPGGRGFGRGAPRGGSPGGFSGRGRGSGGGSAFRGRGGGGRGRS